MKSETEIRRKYDEMYEITESIDPVTIDYVVYIGRLAILQWVLE
jgi:hypothetical protein